MRNSVLSALMFGLAASFIGCATDAADPAEGSISSEVREQAANYVLACGGLALREWDHPDAAVKETLPYGFIVHVGQVDWASRMANITPTDAHPKMGWMRIDGANGPLLSTDKTSCN
jgi:hypothetical protein